MKRVKVILIFLLLGFFLFTGISSCGSDEPRLITDAAPSSVVSPILPSSPVASTSISPQPPQGVVYKFAVPPWQKGQSLEDIRTSYAPMLEFLSQETGQQFAIAGANDYEEVATGLATGKFQLATISPVLYITARQQNPGIRMLVTELSWDTKKTKKSDSYQSFILALKQRSDLQSLQNLQGKKFGFVTKKSTGGFIIPDAAMQKQGLRYQSFFAKTFFLGSHSRVTDAIAAGSIDAGATWTFNWSEAIAKHGDIFKAILTSPPIPNPGVAAHPSIPADLQQRIQTALTKLDETRLQGLSAAGYVVRPDSFYDGIRQLETN